MTGILKYLLTAIPMVALFGCGVRDGGIDNAGSDWTSEDCMNGYYIVTDSLRSGLADAQGNLLVPMAYSRLLFLTGDVLAGYEPPVWTFIYTDGRVLAEISGSVDEDPDLLLAEYQDIRRRQGQAWDRIVTGYEHFCEMCSAPDADAEDMRMMGDSLMMEVSLAEGIMSPEQRRRVEVAQDRYREGRESL